MRCNPAAQSCGRISQGVSDDEGNKLCTLLLLLVLSVSARAGDTPGTYTNYTFDPAVTALDSVDFGIKVISDPGYRANVFWSNQFSLVGTSSGGYTGMQSNGGSDRMFLFSVWDATEAKAGTPGSACVDFGGEGIGKSCRMAHECSRDTPTASTLPTKGTNGSA